MSGPVFVASARPEASPSPVLVVACSKDRHLAAPQEFLERHLGLSEGGYHLVAVPGGPQFLVVSGHLPKFAWAGHRWLRFASERMGVTRVVLVAHEGCLWSRSRVTGKSRGQGRVCTDTARVVKPNKQAIRTRSGPSPRTDHPLRMERAGWFAANPYQTV